MKPRNNEAEYQQIKKVLDDSNINTVEKLDEKIQGMLKAARLYSLLGGLLMIILLLLLPRFSIFTVMIFCLFMAWLWSSTLASKHYFQRYLDESNIEGNSDDHVNENRNNEEKSD